LHYKFDAVIIDSSLGAADGARNLITEGEVWMTLAALRTV
jgi:hypothetical protein